MATKTKEMGEEPTTEAKPREMGNTAMHVRDDGSKLIEQVIEDLELITKNQVNDEEAMETIAAQAVSDLNLVLRSLEHVGAQTAPHYELEARIKLKRSRINLTPVMA